jgi:glycerol-3-phosphate dehydrogenase (NAD(P)+)
VPAAVAAHGERIPARAGVLVVADGPAAAPQVHYVAERVRARAVAWLAAGDDPAGALAHGEPVVVASADAAFLAQIAAALRAAGCAVTRTSDVSSAQLATVRTSRPQRSRAA